MDDFIKSKGKHSQKPFGVPVLPSSVLYTRGWLGLNCNGKDIENNVHWFTLYYSLSQEKTSARPVPSRAYPVILCCTKANCALLCYPRLYCHATRPPAPSTTIYSRVQTTMRPGRGKGLNRGFWWHIVLKNGLIGEYRTQWFYSIHIFFGWRCCCPTKNVLN